jgi:hypothetical protein
LKEDFKLFFKELLNNTLKGRLVENNKQKSPLVAAAAYRIK